MKSILVCLLAAAALAPSLRAASIQQTTNIINDCERRTNKFKKTLDKALARDNVRAGQAREDQLNRDASNLENALDRVGDSWNRDHNLNKTRNFVTAAVVIARDIDKSMRFWSMGGDAESEWAAVRAELNKLARTFAIRGV